MSIFTKKVFSLPLEFGERRAARLPLNHVSLLFPLTSFSHHVILKTKFRYELGPQVAAR